MERLGTLEGRSGKHLLAHAYKVDLKTGPASEDIDTKM